MKQNDSKYHLLYLKLKEEGCEKEVLELVKDLYQENQELLSEKDDEGKYGIRYKTIHDDFGYADKHEQFFLSKEKRDNVFEDWMEGRFWDRIFNTELEYRTPSPHVHDIVKVFKESGKIYEEI